MEEQVTKSKNIVDCDGILPEAPLTTSTRKVIPSTRYRFGRKVIRIPVLESSLNEVTLIKWLPDILRIHAENASDCRHFEKVYRGESHIWEKERPFNSGSKMNTIINENHAFYQIEFKKGYMYGNPVNYSCADDGTDSDSITYLNRYLKLCGKAFKDIELGETIFKCGNAYRMSLPKVYAGNTNYEKQTPFEMFNLDNETTFVVYSSDYTKKKLMAGIITTIDSPNPNETEFEIIIYTRDFIYKFRCYSLCPAWDGINFKSKKPNYLGKIPIVEFYTNSARMGVIDINETIFDAINNMSSDSIDSINDFVNSILVIYNMTINKDDKQNIDETGSLQLITTDPSKPAEAKYLVNQLQQSDVMARYETAIKWCYNIVGVPQPTQKSTSGGDTGEARELGGGWENANIVANQNEEPLKDGDMRMFEIQLAICRMTPKCPVKDLYETDIEINFNRTRSNNLITKTQALQTLNEMDMPEEVALNIVGITSNSHEVARDWVANKEKKKKESLETMKQQADINKKTEPNKNSKTATT